MINLNAILCALIAGMPLAAAGAPALDLSAPRNIAPANSLNDANGPRGPGDAFKDHLTEDSPLTMTRCPDGSTHARRTFMGKPSDYNPCKPQWQTINTPPSFVPEIENEHIRRRESERR